MGLDITAYRRVTKIDAVFDSEGEPIDPVNREYVDYDCRVFANQDFPNHHEGVEPRGIYVAEESDGFRAGSYSGYNAWREELAKLAGYPAVPVDRYNTGNVQMRHDYGAWEAGSGPFWELINFSDCDGTIGPVISAKLANDFAEWDEKAKAHDTQMPWFYEKYQEWRHAFQMAADGGMVRFH